jgi:alcohol dehydrogenase class IV
MGLKNGLVVTDANLTASDSFQIAIKSTDDQNLQYMIFDSVYDESLKVNRIYVKHG